MSNKDSWSNWVVSVPHCCVVISIACRHHNGSHDSCNVESWPLEHEAVQKSLLCEVSISSFLHLFFNWDSSGIMDWLRLVSVIVGLNQKPLSFAEFIISMDWIGISFDNHTFIGSYSWNNKVNRTSNSFSF